MWHSAFARRMEMTSSASVPKVSFILSVLRLQLVGVGKRRIFPPAMFLPEIAEIGNPVGKAWSDTSRPAVWTVTPKPVLGLTRTAGKLWWRF